MELDWIREITRAEGPFATVYLDASHDTPDAPRRIELTWRRARAELAGAGADEPTLAALDEAVERLATPADVPAADTADTTDTADRPPGRVGRVLVAAGGTVLLDEWLPDPPEQPTARWAETPDLVPALTRLPERLATVVAVVDATGADLYTGRHVEHLDTARYPMHQVRAGGLSHLTMRHRVEEHERASAAEVAHAIDTAVARTNAAVLVLAGETQSRSRVRRALGRRAGEIAEEVDGGGRAPGADGDELERAVARAVDRAVSDARRAEAERYERLAGQADGRAVDGVGPVAEALRAAQVDALYLDADQVCGQPMWIGPEPEQLATRREELAALDIEASGPVAAADALLRAAAGTGARLHLVGGGRTGLVGRPLADGVGAVLRGGRPESTNGS